MCAYLRFVYLVVVVVSVLKSGDCLKNVTTIECDLDSCKISCHDGKSPFEWKYTASSKNEWKVIDDYTTRNLTLSVDTHGYYLCQDSNHYTSNVFYVVGREEPASSETLTAVIVVAVLFGIGFLIMVASAGLKCYRSHASQSLENEVTIREKPQEYDVVSRSVRKRSVDDDGYIIPLNPENRDSDYLEIDCPHMQQTPQMTQSCRQIKLVNVLGSCCSHASQSLENEVTIREKSQEYDVVSRSVRKSSVDDDGYIIPLNPENRDSDYLEIDCPHMQQTAQTQSCGPLYENLESMRKTANRL